MSSQLRLIRLIRHLYSSVQLLQVQIVLESAHPIDDPSDASSVVISSDTVIKTLIFQKSDVVMMAIPDVNLDYAIIGMLLLTIRFMQVFLSTGA